MKELLDRLEALAKENEALTAKVASLEGQLKIYTSPSALASIQNRLDAALEPPRHGELERLGRTVATSDSKGVTQKATNVYFLVQDLRSGVEAAFFEGWFEAKGSYKMPKKAQKAYALSKASKRSST